MAWDGLLLPASFRGIPFFVDSHRKTGGRNAVSHEPPDRDKTFAEDMGKMTDGYMISGHVLGDTYFFIRDALITAMETREPGILIHPYLGLIDVQPTNYTFSEDTTEGRIARFELNFVDAGEPNAVFGFIDKATSFVTSVIAAVAQVENAFRLVAKFSGLPAFVSESAESLISGFNRTVEESIATIGTNKENESALRSDIEDLDDNKKEQIKDLSVVNSVSIIIESLKELVEVSEDNTTIDRGSGSDPYLSVFDGILDYTDEQEVAINAIDPLTDTRLQQQISNNALNQAIRQYTIIRLAEVSADKNYNSIDEAINQRNRITKLIEDQLAIEDLDDNLFQALEDLKYNVTELIPDARKIPGTTKTLNIISSTPSLVLAYEIYGNVDNELDIIDRNLVEDPGFIDGVIKVVVFG